MTLPSPANVFPTKAITAFQIFPNIFGQNKLRPFTFRATFVTIGQTTLKNHDRQILLTLDRKKMVAANSFQFFDPLWDTVLLNSQNLERGKISLF